MTFQVLDLFSGIGGFSLGLERTGGFNTVAFCEIDPFCRKVLEKHWPQVHCYEDIKTLTKEVLEKDGIYPTLLCGGFPCQDISVAGKGAGLSGERSGLWFEFARLISEIRPKYVIVENVSALLVRGIDRVLGSLAEIGYDAEWHCIPASAVGAPHRRDRVWITAYSSSVRDKKSKQDIHETNLCVLQRWQESSSNFVRCSSKMANSNKPRLERWLRESLRERFNEQWIIEPDVGRVADGVSARMDRLKSLGNAVVPQIPELIGRAILAYEEEHGTCH